MHIVIRHTAFAMKIVDAAPAPLPAASESDDGDLAFQVRGELIRAICGPEVPDQALHERIVAWAGSVAPNTLRAMRSDLRVVEAFQAQYDRPTLPLAPIDLTILIGERARAGIAKATIDRLIASMVRIHDLARLPSCVDDTVRWKAKENRRRDTREVRQARGLRLKGEAHDVVEDAAQPISVESLLESIPDDISGLRDRAIISAGYDAGLRRSEVVRIRVEHIERLPNGEASLFIPRSKTDQLGEGSRAWLSARSVAYIDEWLSAAQITEGYVFRSLSYRVGQNEHLDDGAVSRILKGRLKAHLGALCKRGFMNEEDADTVIRGVSSHSLRVGCDQDLFASGIDIGAIMQGLRWTNPKQPLAYARHLAPSTSKLASLLRRARSRTNDSGGARTGSDADFDLHSAASAAQEQT